MAEPTLRSSYDRGIDGSRMADYDYGYRNGKGKAAVFEVFRAYQEGRPWVYADYWKDRKLQLLNQAQPPELHG
jgi:hypothetical protein